MYDFWIWDTSDLFSEGPLPISIVTFPKTCVEEEEIKTPVRLERRVTLPNKPGGRHQLQIFNYTYCWCVRPSVHASGEGILLGT